MSIVYQFLTRRKVQVQDEEQTRDVGSVFPCGSHLSQFCRLQLGLTFLDDDEASARGVGRDITGLHPQLSLLQLQLPRQSQSNPCNSLVPAFLQKNSRGKETIFRTPESLQNFFFLIFFSPTLFSRLPETIDLKTNSLQEFTSEIPP